MNRTTRATAGTRSTNARTHPARQLDDLTIRLVALEAAVTGLTGRRLAQTTTPGKEYYSTAELAAAMGVGVHTVTARWCCGRRIEAVKDTSTGRWKIPEHEYRRLVRGGSLRPKAKE